MEVSANRSDLLEKYDLRRVHRGGEASELAGEEERSATRKYCPAALNTMKLRVIDKDDIVINKDFASFLNQNSLHNFDDFMRLKGSIRKVVKERSTSRVKLGTHTIYVKQCQFAGIWEILKNLLHRRLPPGAFDEWRAILSFHSNGIPTMVPISAGRRCIFPGLERESFLATAELECANRLDYFLTERFPAPCRGEILATKRRILIKLADLTRRMHTSGFNHRDYYLCHIFIDKREDLHIIDLHRVDIRKRVGRKWLVKDLAALLFSSLDIPITSGQRLAFYKRYMRIERLSKTDRRSIRRIVRASIRIARNTKRRYVE